MNRQGIVREFHIVWRVVTLAVLYICKICFVTFFTFSEPEQGVVLISKTLLVYPLILSSGNY